MIDILIALLVVVVAILTLGAVNHETTVTIDFVVGTWRDASLLAVSAVVAAIVGLTGLLAATYARMRGDGDRRKLTAELDRVYLRVREVEAGSGGLGTTDTPDRAVTPAATPPATPPATVQTPDDAPSEPAAEAASDRERAGEPPLPAADTSPDAG